ncbi:hypothetical protein RRG08_034710 [Elysia crispata]|uniref:Apple domain-containing protein n=1 Tax=Elysia crispata TaxID=231223 RepID=A0AAE0Z114_9GAST|nr:hypothetical protein RRG08_034710 [Elysia crispata]
MLGCSGPALCLLLVLRPAMAFVLCNDCRQTKFKHTRGQKVVSGADHLASFSSLGMSNILCAAYCRQSSECDLYHFSTLNNVCVTFKKTDSFNPVDGFTSDPDWSTSVQPGVWTLAFRAQSRVGVSTYSTWLDSSQQDDNPYPADFPPACLRLKDYGQCDRHFRSQVLDNWVNIQEVYFSLVKNDVEVAFILFDGTSSDMTSWFSQDRILDSTWSSLASDNNLEPVRISGECQSKSCRRFRVHESWTLCKVESFYTFTIDKGYDICTTCCWEPLDLSTSPVFLYSPVNGRASVGIERGSLALGREAEVLSVWVKFNDF